MKTLKLAVLAVASLIGVAQVRAQQTNVVQNLGIQLYGVSQGGSFSNGTAVGTNVNFVRIDTRQVIQALAAASFNTFSSTSRLVVVTPLGGGAPRIQVRDGSKTPFDVTDYFNFQALTDPVNGSVTSTRNGRGTSVSYEIARFALQDADGRTLSLHFDVNGFTTTDSSSVGFFGSQGPNTDANVSGAGDRNGGLLILQGSINIYGRTLEVVSGIILS